MTTLALATEHQAVLDAHAGVSDEGCVVSDFLDWLEENGVQLGSYSGAFGAYKGPLGHTLYPIGTSKADLVYRFFGVDPVALEKARRALLDAVRAHAPGGAA